MLYFLDKTEETPLISVTVTNVKADISNEYLPNTSQILILETNYFINSLALVINLDAIFN
jgi:hypothetical protein